MIIESETKGSILTFVNNLLSSKYLLSSLFLLIWIATGLKGLFILRLSIE